MTVLVGALFAVAEQPSSRSFEEEEMKAYMEMDEFSYMNLTVRPPSIWERLQWWFAGLIAKIFGNPNSPWLTKIVFYVLLFVVLGVAVFYVLRLKYGSGVTSESRYSSIAGVGALENTKAVDFDKLIEEARKNEEFRLAIRYQYLKSLQFLATEELIKLRDWKSPYDYKRELKVELVPIYSKLSELFEFVWYGDFNAGEKELNSSSDLLVELKRSVGEKG